MEAPIQPDGQQFLELNVISEEVFDCQESRLVHEYEVKGNKITVRIRGVEEPENCTTQMGPVKAQMPLGELAPGLYQVKVMINRQLFKASLQVGPQHFELRSDDDPDLFRIGNGRLNLIPTGLIWGQAQYGDDAGRARAQEFVAALQQAGATPPELAAGDYGEFYVHYDSAPDEVSTGPGKYALPFVLAYAGDLNDLKSLFDQFSSDLDLSLANRKGQRFD